MFSDRRPLYACAAALGVALGWPRLPAAAPVDAPGEAFSAARALRHIEAWAVRPRPRGSAEQVRVLAALESTFAEAGFEVSRQGRPGLVNLIVRAPGAGDDGVWLVAHSDSVPAGPGAADDGLGLGVLAEVARAVGPHPRLHLLVTDGEEEGLYGAEAFVAAGTVAPQLLINVEARGTEGPAYMFQTSGPAAPLLDAWSAAGCSAQATSLAKVVYDQLPNDTDFTVFREAGWWGYDFALIGGAWRYHTREDTPANLDPRSVQMVGDCVLGLTRQWLDRPREGEGRRVYAQVAGHTVALGPAAIQVLGALVLVVNGRPPRSWGVVGGLAVWVLALLVAGAAGLAALLGAAAAWPGFLVAVAEVPGPEPLYAAAAVIGVAALAGGAALARRFAGGAWGWDAAAVGVATLAAILAPEAGYALLPGAWAAVAARRGWWPGVALAGFAAAALLTPVVYAIFPALTSRMLPVLAVLPVVLFAWVPGVLRKDATPG